VQSSKYLQSDTRHSYSEIKELLNAGKIVFFTGKPRQNERLRSYLGGKLDDLFRLDTIYHSKLSLKVYRQYLNEFDLGEDFIKMDFRDKRDDWKSALTTTTTTTSTYSRPANNDDFMRAFPKIFACENPAGNVLSTNCRASAI
jgi:hypothetical protein